MKKSIKIIVLAAGVLALAAVSFFGARALARALPEKKTAVTGDTSLLGAYSEYSVFDRIPSLSGKSVRYETATDDGADTYGINVYDTTLDEYNVYLKVLADNGFTKYTDNGENGLEGYVYKTYFQKGDLRVSVTHMRELRRTMISASEKGAWSEHLVYSGDYVADNDPDAKTTLYLPELYTTGASFYLRLKNGHFIINDGGTESELPYLLDDLEKLTPEGEKPVIEAWMISHPHIDHMGVFKALLENPEQLERIYVQNVYYNCMSAEAEKYYAQWSEDKLQNYVRGLPVKMKSTSGMAPSLYEMAVGDKYYFNDLTMEVVYSSEALPYEDWVNINGTSTWMLYTIEGQKLLFSADGTWPTQKWIMKTYGSDYLDIDLLTTPHHGYDVTDEFTNYMARIGTVLYTNYHTLLGGDTGISAQTAVLRHLNEACEEAYTYGDGTIKLSFPYEIGSAEVLTPREWSYNIKKPPR